MRGCRRDRGHETGMPIEPRPRIEDRGFLVTPGGDFEITHDLFSFSYVCIMYLLLRLQVMLFTYTDKDGFVPPSDRADGSVGGRSKLTTGDGGPHSYLEEAVTNMPRKAATSSVEPSAAATGARAGVSETAAVIQTHLAREDKFKVSGTAFVIVQVSWMYTFWCVCVTASKISRGCFESKNYHLSSAHHLHVKANLPRFKASSPTAFVYPHLKNGHRFFCRSCTSWQLWTSTCARSPKQRKQERQRPGGLFGGRGATATAACTCTSRLCAPSKRTRTAR